MQCAESIRVGPWDACAKFAERLASAIWSTYSTIGAILAWTTNDRNQERDHHARTIEQVETITPLFPIPDNVEAAMKSDQASD